MLTIPFCEVLIMAAVLGKLLVVDDEEIICRDLKRLGEKLGFSVQVAFNGLEGWRIFKDYKPDIAILDIYMPGMNGLGLLRLIKEHSANCPVILITGFLHFEQLVTREKLKPDGFIVKPFQSVKIANQLLELIQKKNHQTDFDGETAQTCALHN
jgi:YesN/AraC family two-component response regulator